MALNITIPRAVYPVQTQTVQDRVANSVTKYKLTLQRFSWPSPDQVVMTIAVEYSLDNRATWLAGMRASYTGGDTPERGLVGSPIYVPANTSIAIFELPGVTGPGRWVRATMDILVPLEFSGTLETF